MEIYILDSLLRRTHVFDQYQSLIWTERWRDIGDLELDIKSTFESRSHFITGTQVAINESHRVMTVETVEDTTDDEGQQILKVKGRSLEAILEDRVAMLEGDIATWTITDKPGDVIREMFDHICRPPGGLVPEDVIPFIQPGSLFPVDNSLETATIIKHEQKPASLFNAIKALADTYDLGFRLVRNFDTSQLYFDVYAGSDRTTRQTVLAPVVFAVNLDNIRNTTEFSTIQASKNVAYVYAEVTIADVPTVVSQTVYGENVDPDIDGFDRKVLVVNASITEGEPDIPGALFQAGTEALQQNRASSYFDGEIDQRTDYKYGVDYNLGDLVEMRNRDGIITYKRATEQIFVSDGEGDRAYPTLEMDLFANANTWLSWRRKSKTWSEFGLTEYWVDQ